MKPSRSAAVRQAKYSGKNSVNMAVPLIEVDSVIDDIAARVDEAIRPAAFAASDVFYKAVLKNVDALGSKTGKLRGAIYQAYSKDNSGPLKATYHVSWSAKKAPHGHLVEYGHIQRYAVHEDGGKFYTLVRPSKRGMPKPGRRASQAAKDAYYVLRAGGPQQIPAQPFVRPAVYQASGAAVAAARAKLLELVAA
jgi:hypothetical protein